MTQHLWYLRVKGVVSGPFPAPQLRQSFSLGELDLDDAVSLDGKQWLTLMQSGILDSQPAKATRVPDTDDDWRREREKARLRWLDDSIEVAGDMPVRDDEVGLRLRQHEAETRSRLDAESRRPPAFLVGLAAFLIIALIGVGVWLGQSGQSGIQTSLANKAIDCQQPPGEGVNWNGCDKREAVLAGARLKNARLAKVKLERADLSAAELAYADLQGANLRGASLRGAALNAASLGQADLTGADLTGADLRFAVLTGAFMEGVRLDGARLDQATWLDGRVCAVASVGACQ
ncbi:MAG: pentapeptide repeat-containing protein [Pseudomonadota bacterium]